MIYWEGSKFNMVGSMTVCEIVTTAAREILDFNHIHDNDVITVAVSQ